MNTSFFSVPMRVAILGLVLASAAGCQGTVQTRWVKSADTYDVWTNRMDELPVRIHQPGQADDVRDIHGDAWKGTNTAAINMNTRRIELYVGGTQTATSASVCSAQPQLVADAHPANGTLTMAALCDGTRLVTTAENHVSATDAQSFAHLLKEVRSRILYAISISRTQVPVQQYG